MKQKLLFVLLTMFFAGSLFGQTRQLTGKVTSEADKQPIPAVTVLIKGTQNGTTTGPDGRFSLSFQSQTGTLVFSSIGYRKLEVPITSSNTYDVAMEIDVMNIDEVVVTALGISREKKTLGYAVQDVSAAELTEAKDNNIINTLSGKIAGVQVTSGGSTVGSSSRVVIRGNKSFSGNDPLFVIDGTPIFNNTTNLDGGGGIDWGNTAADIDPNNIESMTVLKGANAAALYGSRATNGVILITTKKGKDGRKLGVDFTTSMTFDNVAYLPKFQNEYGGGWNGEEFIWKRDHPEMSYQDYSKTYGYNWVDGGGGGVNDSWPINWGPRLDAGLLLDQWSTGPNSPWISRQNNYRDFFQTGTNAENSLAISSNGDKAMGRLAFTNNNTKGIIDFTDQSQQTINGSITLKPTSRLTAVTNLTYLKKTSNNLPNNGYSGIGVDYAWLQRDFDINYTKQVYKEKGNKDFIFPDGDNPYYNLRNLTGFNRDRLFGNSSIDYQITDWLSVLGRVGIDFYNEYRKDITQSGTQGNISRKRGGQFNQTQFYFNETNADLMLKFDKTLGDIRLDGIIGGNYRDVVSQSMYMAASDLTVPDLYTIGNVKGNPTVTMNTNRKVVNSVFFAANGSYKNFLFLGVTGRNDWSSTLPAANRSYFYPSVSLGFDVTEAFKLQSDILSYAKLRGSWARVGGDAGAYQLNNTYSVGTFNSISMFSPGLTFPPANLKPQITSSFEFGGDFRLWKNRLSLDITYYDQTTVNQILSVATSLTTGYSAMRLNAGEISNSGIELMLTGKVIDKPDGLSWDIMVNWAKNKSQVNELYGDLESYRISNGFGGATTVGIPGQPWGVIWGLPYVRDSISNKIVVGSDGIPLTTNVGKNLGNVTPDWTGGIRNTFNYKGLYLGFLIDMRKGGDFFSCTAWHAYPTGTYEITTQNNVRETGLIVDGVKEDGTPNDIRVSAQDFYGGAWMWNNHEYSILDGTYIKLREVVLGYDVPVSKIKWIQKLNISVYGRNLAILYRDKSTAELGIDPEVGLGGGDSGVGFENFQIPTTRSLGVKLRLSF
ncbi:MAG: SusC/RagA family TonB-linked outer membrane protein [Bacteroidales bacterium]|jgi:TonB-linked SusC/RagA family outer membrane protein